MNDSTREEILEAWLNDELTEGQVAELQGWLLDHRENRRQFVELKVRDQLLREVAKAEAGLESLEEPEKVIFRFPAWSWIPAAAAAALIVMLGIKAVQTPESNLVVVQQETPGDPVATVQSARKMIQYEKGEQLHEGQVIHLEKGRIAIRFDSGAKVAVTAPAEFTIVGTNAVRFLLGQATVRVPGKIKGFVLDTPAERVIDLGTSFGVDVDEFGATAISVFEGEVELGAGQRLLAGQSVEMAKSRPTPREIPYAEGQYAETWQLSFGIEALNGKVRLATPSERSIPGQVEDGESLLLFPEREDVLLPQGYLVDAMEPGVHKRPFRKNIVALSDDSRVDSFLLQYNPVRSGEISETTAFQGELHFDRAIVALILQKDLLDDSDSILGLSGIDFSNTFRRGINADDVVTLSSDLRTLLISFNLLNGVDQIRVLVASDYPAQSL